MSHFVVPSHVLVGRDAVLESKSLLKEYGKKAFIVTGKHVGKSPMIEKLKDILDSLEIEYDVFDGITGEPTDKMVEEGVTLYQKAGCDFFIGIGGGSPLDAAKAIAFMTVSKGKISDYNGIEVNAIVPPIVAIPTTAGTGSEATKFTIITDQEKDIKMLLKGDCLVPTLAVVDTSFSMDMPKDVTASTGLDALTHAVEAYTSKKAFSLTDSYAISSVKRIMKYLPIAYEDGRNAKAREELAIAALEAGICINNSSVTLVHGMSRPIGALFHVPHGMSNAMLLNECLSFALDGAFDRFADLGLAIGVGKEGDNEEELAAAFLVKVKELCTLCQVPSLKEYGIEENSFMAAIDKMSGDAIASGSPSNTRKMVSKEDCMNIYRRVYK